MKVLKKAGQIVERPAQPVRLIGETTYCIHVLLRGKVLECADADVTGRHAGEYSARQSSISVSPVRALPSAFRLCDLPLIRSYPFREGNVILHFPFERTRNMAKFIAELRRRHIYRVGVTYIVVAWILLQLFNNLAPIAAPPVRNSPLF